LLLIVIFGLFPPALIVIYCYFQPFSHVFTLALVAAGVSPAVDGGILPPVLCPHIAIRSLPTPPDRKLDDNPPLSATAPATAEL
jgi:hypothetical protein